MVDDDPVIDWANCTHCGECLKFSHNHDIHLQAEVIEFEVNVGAVVVATGFRPYEPFPGELGYAEFPEVIYAEPNYVAYASDEPLAPPVFVPNDPFFSYQWHMPLVQAPQARTITMVSIE